MDDSILLKAKLLDLLEQRYQKDPGFFVNKSTISIELGITDEDAFKYADYLVNNKWATISEPSSSSRWRIMITDEGKKELKRIRNVIVETKKNNTNEKDDDIKLLKIDEKIKEVNLEKERRKGVAEQKFYGAVIELLDFQRDIIKQREERNKEVIEIKNRLSKLENLFSNPHEQLIQHIYEPCYNQMMNIYQRQDFITDIPQNPWENLSHTWKLRTDEEIKKLFENFENELQIWRLMWIDFGNKFQNNHKDIAKFLDPVFEKFKLIKEDGRFNFGGSNHDSENWLFNCQDVIFNENIPNGEELYQILKAEGMRRYREEYAITYDAWKKEIPEIYNEILKVIPKLVEVLDAKYSYEEIDKQRNILKEKIEKLTLALEEKLK